MESRLFITGPVRPDYFGVVIIMMINQFETARKVRAELTELALRCCISSDDHVALLKALDAWCTRHGMKYSTQMSLI